MTLDLCAKCIEMNGTVQISFEVFKKGYKFGLRKGLDTVESLSGVARGSIFLLL